MASTERVTLKSLREKADSARKIVMLAAYDYPFAVLAQQAGIDGIIVGDSVAMTVYGHENTLQADMDMMIRHTQAVRRGAGNLFVIGDMPYMSYQPSIELAIRNAGRFMAEAGADAVKFEGGLAVLDTTGSAVRAGIPVVGHIGFTPQSAALTGGTIVATRQADRAVKLVDEAQRLEQAGICLLILEAVPQNVAVEVVKRVGVPVIGIGSGPACHGQVILMHEILGLTTGPALRFVQKYVDLADDIVGAFGKYAEQVRSGEYPAPQHCYNMNPEQQEAFSGRLARLDE